MKDRDIHQVISILEDVTSGWTETALTLVAEQTRRDPFRILIGTVLSLRTKDETTAAACERLFGLADTPEASADPARGNRGPRHLSGGVPCHEGAQHSSRSAGSSWRSIRAACRTRSTRWSSCPVWAGRRQISWSRSVTASRASASTPTCTASPTAGDISTTRNPDQSEWALREKLPSEYWIRYNDLLVMYGQNLCKPVSPFCSRCRLSPYCKRVGVDKHR